MNKDAVLQSYLIYDDREDSDGNTPTKPVFYAFGSGEFEVQVIVDRFTNKLGLN